MFSHNTVSSEEMFATTEFPTEPNPYEKDLSCAGITGSCKAIVFIQQYRNKQKGPLDRVILGHPVEG